MENHGTDAGKDKVPVDRGYYLEHRDFDESRAWNHDDSRCWKIWCYLKMRASWASRRVGRNTLQPGDILTSYGGLAAGCQPEGLDPQTQKSSQRFTVKIIRRFLDLFKEWKYISVRPSAGSQGLIVTILQWSSKQSKQEERTDTGQTAGRLRADCGQTKGNIQSLILDPGELKSEEPEKSNPRANTAEDREENQGGAQTTPEPNQAASRLSSSRFDESSGRRTDAYYSQNQKPLAPPSDGNGDKADVLPICPNLGCGRRMKKQAVIPLKDGSGWFCPENNGGCGAHYERRLWKQKGRKLVDLEELWRDRKTLEEKAVRDKVDKLKKEHPEQFASEADYQKLIGAVAKPLKKKATDHGLGSRT